MHRPGAPTPLDCPFHEKEHAKALGAQWDHGVRKWFVPALTNLAPFARWLPGSIAAALPQAAQSAAAALPPPPPPQAPPPAATGLPPTYINCSFHEKYEAKALGARWGERRHSNPHVCLRLVLSSRSPQTRQ